ncbi:hypothetical protein LCGC14_1963860 [marine sediment metagenome]|uniref:Uncharacterized protein n=1 Tax=marine sediment metagenome TaxID=412755 RepID=A0A0F9HS56_9ZZZZ
MPNDIFGQGYDPTPRPTLDRHCAISRVTIKPQHRNSASSLGLGYPFVSARLGDDLWAIWNRHSGRVLSVISDRVDWRGAEVARQTLEAVNGCAKHDPAMNVLHDMVA